MDVVFAGDIHGHDIADPTWRGKGYFLVKWMGIWDKRMILGGGVQVIMCIFMEYYPHSIYIHGIYLAYILTSWIINILNNSKTLISC